MMTKEEHISFWIEQAIDDWVAVNTLYKGKNYLQSLFFAHLVIEKLCKALWIKNNEGNIPPKSHNLIQIISNSNIEITAEFSELMLKLNRFQLEGRYPEYITKMLKICNEQFTIEFLEATNKLKQWLIAKLH